MLHGNLVRGMKRRVVTVPREVCVGQVWTFANGERYVVLCPNDSREAGPDSWVMQALGTPKTAKIAYMHHRARMGLQWAFVPVLTFWERLAADSV